MKRCRLSPDYPILRIWGDPALRTSGALSAPPPDRPSIELPRSWPHRHTQHKARHATRTSRGTTLDKCGNMPSAYVQPGDPRQSCMTHFGINLLSRMCKCLTCLLIRLMVASGQAARAHTRETAGSLTAAAAWGWTSPRAAAWRRQPEALPAHAAGWPAQHRRGTKSPTCPMCAARRAPRWAPPPWPADAAPGHPKANHRRGRCAHSAGGGFTGSADTRAGTPATGAGDGAGAEGKGPGRDSSLRCASGSQQLVRPPAGSTGEAINDALEALAYLRASSPWLAARPRWPAARSARSRGCPP